LEFVRAKTAQDARQICVGVLGGYANDRNVQLEPEVCPKTAQDARHLFFEFSCISQPTACSYKAEVCPKTAQDARQFCFRASAVPPTTAMRN
jgi:hypothetical protein